MDSGREYYYYYYYYYYCCSHTHDPLGQQTLTVTVSKHYDGVLAAQLQGDSLQVAVPCRSLDQFSNLG